MYLTWNAMFIFLIQGYVSFHR